jgi:hypothetical protein
MNERSALSGLSPKRFWQPGHGKRPTGSPRPQLEQLEDRMVPSATPTLDLTSYGAIGSINGSIFQQSNPQPTGCGVIHDFVRLQAHGTNQAIEQGYNTDARPLQFDEKNSPVFTRSLQLNELPTINIGGTVYREFLLGVNQKTSQPYLSLDELRLYVSTAPNLMNYDATALTLGGQAPIYDMGPNNWVKLDSRLSHGNGSGDMFLYVPDQLFTGGVAGANPYVYLYSKFGVNFASNGGFEQWAPPVPVAATGAISGHVSCSDGTPEADVKIVLANNPNGILTGDEVYTYTDASGNYQFNDLAAGFGAFSTYYVTAIPPADALNTQNLVDTVVLTAAIPVQGNVNFVVNCTQAVAAS